MNAMENLLFDALRRKFEGDIAAAKANINVYKTMVYRLFLES